MSRQVLLAGPSVPIPTVIPFLTNLSTGHIPLASFMLEPGLVTTESFFLS